MRRKKDGDPGERGLLRAWMMWPIKEKLTLGAHLMERVRISLLRRVGKTREGL